MSRIFGVSVWAAPLAAVGALITGAAAKAADAEQLFNTLTGHG